MSREDFCKFIRSFCRESYFDNEVMRDQLLCLWTSFCLIFGFDVDTCAYDVEIGWLWKIISETEAETADWSDYESFCNYMCKYIV